MPLSDLEGARGRTEVFSIFELLLVFSHVLRTPARQVRNTSTSLQHSIHPTPSRIVTYVIASARMAARVLCRAARQSAETARPVPLKCARLSALHVHCSKRDVKPPAFQTDTSAPYCANG